MTPSDLTPSMLTFLSERHLASLTTLRADGSPHVDPVGFSFDTQHHIVRIITFDNCTKVRNARRGGRAAVSQVDGGRWLTLEGTVSATSEPQRVSAAVLGYTLRYRQPKERSDRVAIEIIVDRVMGNA